MRLTLGDPLFFLLFSVVRPTQIFGIFQKQSNNVVKPFFTGNNSFNLKNEHSNSIHREKQEQKTGTFFTVYCAFCQSKYVNVKF